MRLNESLKRAIYSDIMNDVARVIKKRVNEDNDINHMHFKFSQKVYDSRYPYFYIMDYESYDLLYNIIDNSVYIQTFGIGNHKVVCFFREKYPYFEKIDRILESNHDRHFFDSRLYNNISEFIYNIVK